jgi:hypothetical protein
MRTFLTAVNLVAVWGFGTQAVVAQSKKIDLQTKEGVAAVKGEWRYHDVKIVEVEGKGPDGKPNKTYNIEPRADAATFDDSKWEVVAPETLKDARSNGQVCFCWYRTKITIPPEAAGKSVFFSDDCRRLRRNLGRRQTAPNTGQRGRGDCRRLQHAQSGRAQRPPAGEGLPDCGLRHKWTDLGIPFQLAFPQEHGS